MTCDVDTLRFVCGKDTQRIISYLPAVFGIGE